MKRPAKYRNRRVTIDGVTYDSQGEYRRWCELQLLERAGSIRNLERQKRIPIVINGVKICDVKIDALYFEGQKRVAEDHKSEYTRTLPVWRLKRKLLEAIYPAMEIREHVK